MKKLSREALPYEVIKQFAEAAGAVECFWRTSDRSFSACVAEVWFSDLKKAAEFAMACSDRIGIYCRVRATSEGFARFYVSAPCLQKW